MQLKMNVLVVVEVEVADELSDPEAVKGDVEVGAKNVLGGAGAGRESDALVAGKGNVVVNQDQRLRVK